MSLFTELKRRNVFRVGIAYAIVAWLLLQVADLVLDNIHAPDWVMQTFMLAIAIGFPVALIFAWAFEMTPEGIKRESEVDRSQSITPHTGRKLDRLIIGVMGAVIVFLLVDRFFLQDRGTEPVQPAAPAAVTSAAKSIAVLPFADLSQGQDQGWFADGLAEEILNALARAPDLLVSSRTSSFKYRGSDLDIPQIAKELGVAHVLEGSVRSGGGRIRVTAQLIRASDGFHLWSENYDRDPADMISIQEDLARNIAKALETTMDPAALAEMTLVGTRSVEAYQAYLRGLELEQGPQPTFTDAREQLNQAYDFYERARALDPQFAAAHRRAAEFWVIQLSPNRSDTGGTGLQPLQMLREFNLRIDRAIDTSPNEIERLNYRAVKASLELRLNDAIDLYQQYLEQRPNDFDAMLGLNNVASLASRTEVRRDILTRIRQRADNDFYASVWYANDAYQIVGATEAAKIGLEMLARWPNSSSHLYQMHRTLLWAGRFEEAKQLAAQYIRLEPAPNHIMEAREACAAGDRATVERILERIDSEDDDLSSEWHVLMLLDRKREAQALLRPLEDSGVPYQLASFLSYPQFDPRPFPALMAVLDREGVKRPPPVEIPFKCPPPESTSIAVLPFVNMSADAENEFFSDGVSEEILNVLARIPELKVAARTSAFAYKGSNRKIGDIASELGVNHVLEGSVRKVGDQVRVTAQLIQASDGFHLWSETYDRKLDNIFAIQDEIAGAIAGQLKVSLGLEKGSSGNLTGTRNLQAYEHYLQGMSLWHQRTVSSLRRAIEEFEQAIALDPQFAKAHAGLALTWAVLPGYDTLDLDTAIAAGESAAQRALTLDPNNAEATAALAMVRQYQGDYITSRELLRRAIELNPSFATAHQWYGVLSETLGDGDTALNSLQRARSLDPKSRIIGYNLAWLLQGLNRLDEAMKVNEDVLESAPDFSDIHAQTMMFATLNGDCERVAKQAAQLVSMLHKTTDSSTTYVALCEAKTAELRAPVLETILSWTPFDYVDPDNPTLTYSYQLWNTLIELGEFDAVFDGIERNGRADLLELGGLRSRRTPNGLRLQCDPRWHELEIKSKLPDPLNPVSCP